MGQNFTILFDLDGTLVDTAPDLMRAHNHVMKNLVTPLSLLRKLGILWVKVQAQCLEGQFGDKLKKSLEKFKMKK